MPGLRLDVKLHGDTELKARFGILQQELESRRRATMWRSVITLREEARSRIHSPEGRAKKGITAEVTGAGNALKGRVRSRRRASIFSQRTRNPGRPMPPVKWIMRWLKRIGQVHTRSSAFLVARAIARKGTKGHPVMNRTLEAKRATIIGYFTEMVEKALRGR